jgi:intracellular multiplication protein IcmK
MTAYQGFNTNLFVVAAHAVSGHPEDLPTVLVIQPTARYGAGNVLVALQGLETPIVLTVVLGQTQVDVRKEFKLRLAGPRAAPEYAPPAPAPVDRTLIDVLNGLPPQPDAQPVNLAGVEPDARAWRVGDYTYLRTLAEIYSPAYEDRASSPSGLHAYKLRTVPVLLASHRGQMVEIRLHP